MSSCLYKFDSHFLSAAHVSWNLTPEGELIIPKGDNSEIGYGNIVPTRLVIHCVSFTLKSFQKIL